MIIAELRRQATREGHCAQHVQAITIAIDQYAEKALGNRDYSLNKPYGVGKKSCEHEQQNDQPNGVRVVPNRLCSELCVAS